MPLTKAQMKEYNEMRRKAKLFKITEAKPANAEYVKKHPGFLLGEGIPIAEHYAVNLTVAKKIARQIENKGHVVLIHSPERGGLMDGRKIVYSSPSKISRKDYKKLFSGTGISKKAIRKLGL